MATGTSTFWSDILTQHKSYSPNNEIILYCSRARAKSGLKIVDAHCRIPEYWNLSFTANSKNTAATVTVELKDISVFIYNSSANYPVLEENTRNEDR